MQSSLMMYSNRHK